MSKPRDYVDALPLLAYKIAPRQFDLSYRFSNISLRDQIVRAQTLVRTLVNTGLVSAKAKETRKEFQLLICGAGAAGLAVAKEAEALNISFVLVEKGTEAPGGVLCSDARRYVSTAMYEWPHPNHNQHCFPLSFPALLGEDENPLPALRLNFGKPLLIKDFGDGIKTALGTSIRDWQQNFAEFQSGKKRRSLLITQASLSRKSKTALRAMLGRAVSIHAVSLRKEALPPIQLVSSSRTAISEEFQFRYVIYAVGFAMESPTYAEGEKPFDGFEHTPFWGKDRVFDEHLGFTKRPKVGILGSGDGALQDALRCLVNVKYEHPLDVWNALMECKQKGRPRLLMSSHVRQAMARVAAADGYTTGGAIWSQQTHVFKSLDEAFEVIIDDLLRREGPKLQHAVDSIIRDDVERVSIVTQHGYFSKAYALNRFLVLLFHKLLATSTKPGKVKFEMRSGTVTGFHKIGSNVRGARIEFEGGAPDMKCDLVIIRGGLDRTKSPSQLVGLTGQDTGRAGLGRIPAPIRPVSIPRAPSASSASKRPSSRTMAVK